jgi:hypothetical protein
MRHYLKVKKDNNLFVFSTRNFMFSIEHSIQSYLRAYPTINSYNSEKILEIMSEKYKKLANACASFSQQNVNNNCEAYYDVYCNSCEDSGICAYCASCGTCTYCGKVKCIGGKELPTIIFSSKKNNVNIKIIKKKVIFTIENTDESGTIKFKISSYLCENAFKKAAELVKIL